jgi:hypothetical protein
VGKQGQGNGVVHTVPTWRDRRALGGGKFACQGPPARPVRVTGQTSARQSAGQFGFRGTRLEGSAHLVVEQVVGILSVVLSLLHVLHLVINTSLEEAATLSLRGATDHAFPIVVIVLIQ